MRKWILTFNDTLEEELSKDWKFTEPPAEVEDIKKALMGKAKGM